MIAFITCNSSLVPLLEGLSSANYAGIYMSFKSVFICHNDLKRHINVEKNHRISLRRLIFNPTYICSVSIKRRIMFYNIYS